MICTALLALAVTVLTEDASTQTRDAFIIASKFPQSIYAVESMDLVLEYSLYNTGDKTALKVTLDDRHSFPTQSFDIIKGLLNVRFEKISPGANATHAVVIRPRQFGVFNYTSAQITYTSEESGDVRVGYTNAPGEGYIYRLKEYERKFALKYLYWVVFFILIAPTTLGSYLAYSKSKRKYEELAKKKN
ncbi:Translocon-associated protein beta [Dictyocaulus viviparus]|uniref:Translocon-associated protein subunit beta n=1 Tax=Dictyocaulus viviparus TaxID=29172 RepID=A0A0D8X8W8_DICVI|nr:Translocon-associated protein beta [Dictyocaulus viviparus]